MSEFSLSCPLSLWILLRRILCYSLMVLSLSSFGCTAKRSTYLNLIIILLDTLRADHVGVYGYERNISPNIDNFANRSCVFLSHRTHSSRTGPSVATLFTGLYQQSHGVINPLTHWDAKGILGASQTTLAEILKDKGYATFGLNSNPNVASRFGFGQGFDTYKDVYKKVPVIHSTQPIMNEAKNILAGQKKGQPFFLYLHFMDTHSPYLIHDTGDRLLTDPSYSGPLTGDHQQLDDILRGKYTIQDADIQHLNDLYDHELLYFDHHFGRLMESIEKMGFLDNTIVVFISDHGEEFFDHGQVLHGYTVYKEQLWVPLIIYAPERSPGLVKGMTRQVDVLPTLLELLRIQKPKSLQGRSLIPQMNGQEVEQPPIFAHAQLRAVKTVQAQSIQLRNWKLIQHFIPAGDVELYDLEQDPKELHNLATQESDRTRRMQNQLSIFAKSLPNAQGETVKMTPEEIRALRSLGYIND